MDELSGNKEMNISLVMRCSNSPSSNVQWLMCFDLSEYTVVLDTYQSAVNLITKIIMLSTKMNLILTGLPYTYAPFIATDLWYRHWSECPRAQ